MKYSFVIGAVGLSLWLGTLQQRALAQIETQSFASEEVAQSGGWAFNDEGQNLERDCDGCETDLGWKSSNVAGGADAGEGGGLTHRSGGLPVGFYGDLTIGELSLDIPITARGKIALVNQNFDGHLHFGFFDGARLLEDPLDYGAHLGFLLAEPGGGVEPNFRWGAFFNSDDGVQEGGHNDFDQGATDGEPLDFSIEYDPEAGSAGLLTVTIGDDPAGELELSQEVRDAGATYTAFGISTGPYTGSGRPDFLEIFIDDVAYTSLLADFTPGDFNGDEVVNVDDFTILANNFDTGSTFEQGDINFDGRIDLRDFAAFRQIFNSQPAGTAAAVPEPCGLSIIAVGFGLLAAIRPRARRRAS